MNEIEQSYTMEDIGGLVEEFLDKNEKVIQKNWFQAFASSKLGYDAFITELKPKLANSCITFINCNYDLSILNSYLFPTVFQAIKDQSNFSNKRIAVPICPACKFLGVEQELISRRLFHCTRCNDALKTPLQIKEYKLLAMFAQHSKAGYKCRDCQRFIPHPLDGSRSVVCPYFDCYFSGDLSLLDKIRHPIVMKHFNTISIDNLFKDKGNNSTNITGKDVLADQLISADTSVEFNELYSQQISAIKDTIESQINALYYSSDSFTFIHKKSVYEAFKLILDRYPHEMISYLVLLKKNVGLQNDIFKEYVSSLEKSLPYSFKKNGKQYIINSLLDDQLSIFSGMSEFDAIVDEKGCIRNGTKEFYIGGRVGFYSRPYWIGKLINVIDLSKDTSILPLVISYSFTKIETTAKSGTQVRVAHLRVPPHYQMGGMSYINRIRRKLVDRIYFILNGKKRQIKY